MKTRTSLVSNSSSSSFIVVFPKRPESIDEVFQHMFNKVDKTIKSQYSDYSRTTKEISIDVFDKIDKKHRCASQKDLLEEFRRLVSIEAYYAFENGSMNRDSRILQDIHKVMKCAEMFGTAKYLELLVEISKLEEEHYIRHDALVAKYGTSKMKWEQYPKAFTDEENELNKLRWDNQRPLNDQKEKILEKKARDMMKSFIMENEGWWYTILSYADEDGEYGSFMEHSDIFRHMKHTKISHH